MLSIDSVKFYDVINHDVSVVAFCSDSCKACVSVENMLKSFKEKYNVALYKFDVMEDMSIAKKYRVMGLPTVILFKKGEPCKQITGACANSKIEELLQYAGNKQ